MSKNAKIAANGQQPVSGHRLKKLEGRMALLFLVPSLFGLLFLNLIPMLIALYTSMTDWVYTDGLFNWNFVGLENFALLFQDDVFIQALVNTIIFTVVTVPVGILVALIVASLIDNYCNVKVAGIIRIALYMPNICNIVATSTIWRALYSSYGPFTNLMRALGWSNPPRWLGNENWALPAVILVAMWAKMGYNVFIYGASMAALPSDLYESAALDGASKRQQFFYLTVPLLSATTFFLTITGIISSFQVFGYSKVMTQGGPLNATNTMVYYIYTTAFKYYRTGYGSAISMVLFLILLAITIVQWVHNNKQED